MHLRSLALLWGPLLSATTLAFAAVIPLHIAPQPAPTQQPIDLSENPFSIKEASWCAEGACWQINDHTVELVRLDPDSLAAHIGLRQGDRITHINHAHMRSLHRFIHAVNRLDVDAGYNIALVRGELPIKLQINVAPYGFIR